MKPLQRVDRELLERADALPLATSAEVAHVNSEHKPPYGFTEPIEYPDGCRLVPVYDGLSIYESPG